MTIDVKAPMQLDHFVLISKTSQLLSAKPADLKRNVDFAHKPEF